MAKSKLTGNEPLQTLSGLKKRGRPGVTVGGVKLTKHTPDKRAGSYQALADVDYIFGNKPRNVHPCTSLGSRTRSPTCRQEGALRPTQGRGLRVSSPETDSRIFDLVNWYFLRVSFRGFIERRGNHSSFPQRPRTQVENDPTEHANSDEEMKFFGSTRMAS